MEQSKTLLDLSAEIRLKDAEIKLLLDIIEETREWYEKEGFNMLAPNTPIIFSKLLSVLFGYRRRKEFYNFGDNKKQ